MHRRVLSIAACVGIVAFVAWLGRAGPDKGASEWTEVAAGVLRSPGPVAGYALRAGDKALLIDAPTHSGDLAKHGVRTIAGVLLTHYHRSVCAGLGALPKNNYGKVVKAELRDILSVSEGTLR